MSDGCAILRITASEVRILIIIAIFAVVAVFTPVAMMSYQSREVCYSRPYLREMLQNTLRPGGMAAGFVEVVVTVIDRVVN